MEICAPGIFLFGSNGGGEAYGFDKRPSTSVVQVSFVGIDRSLVEYLAPSFTEFLISRKRVNQLVNRKIMTKDPDDREIFEIKPVVLGGSLRSPRIKSCSIENNTSKPWITGIACSRTFEGVAPFSMANKS